MYEYRGLRVHTASSTQGLGAQRCYLDPKVMDQLGAKLGQTAELTTENGKYMCTLWPREDNANQYITIDCTVNQCLSTQNGSNSNTCIKDIQLLDISSCEQMSVTVVFEDFKDVSKHKRSSSDLSDIVTDVLYGSVVSPHYRYACKSNTLGKLYGISYLVINEMFPECQACKCTKSIAIIVDKVISKERYEGSLNLKPIILGGLELQSTILRDLIETPIKHKDRLTKLGLTYPKSILLHGPVGCGKTSLVKFVANSSDAHLIIVNGAEVLGALPGESEETIRTIFQKAKCFSEEGFCVLFLDELDALCPARSKGVQAQEGRMVSQLVALFDELSNTQQLAIIGATNRPGSLDFGLRRRFDKELIIGIPTLEQRHSIVKTLTKGLMLSVSVDLLELAEITPGFVGADLASLVQQAAYMGLMEKDFQEPPEVTMEHFKAVLHWLVPSAQRGSDIRVDCKPVLWEDIGGLDHVKTQLKQAIEWPLKHPDSFRRLGLKPPKGVLLYGPPGCAKTKLVQAAATACHVTFLAVSGAQLFSPYVGDSERKIAEVFQQARAGSPSILFIDEIDSVVGSRTKGNKSGGVHDRVLSTLLNEMDGVGIKLDYSHTQATDKVASGETTKSTKSEDEVVDNSRVLVVAATNRPDMLDDALIRPGRIDRILYVPPPDQQARQKILEIHTRNMPLEGVNLQDIAEKCECFTGADLENLCREAALHALSVDGLDVKCVTEKHFLEALNLSSPSISSSKLSEYGKLKYS